MKPIKMFGLAALAALMAMAFVGASSAMAESGGLCTSDPAPCEAVEHVHETTLAGKKAILKTNILTVECDVLFLSTAVLAAGAPQVIHGNFTYSNCNNSCVATEENGPAEIKVLKEGHETSKVTGEGLVHLECGAFIDCLYNGTGLVGTGKGALLSTETNGEVKLTEAVVAEEGGSFFCPDTSKLTITTTPLSATYIAAGQVYCVKYQHANHGLRSGMSCENYLGTRTGQYGLVISGAGHVAGGHLCVLLNQNVGLYENRSSLTTCATDVPANGRPYELGEIL